MKLPRVIVTRPRVEAEQWVSALEAEGFSAEALPLIEIAAVPLAPDAPRAGDYDALMFVSSNAVRHFFAEKGLFSDQKKAFAQSIWARAAIKNIANSPMDAASIPVWPRFMAPGPGTASALLRSGVPAGQIDSPPPDASQFDSEALWREIGGRDWAGKRVLVVRGQTRAGGDAPAPGRDWLARQWQDAGAHVDFISVYERICPQFSAAQRQLAEAARADGSVWLLSSSEAVNNLAGALQIDLARARALATHPRIADAARSAGWGVVAGSRPALHDIVQRLRSIEWPEP